MKKQNSNKNVKVGKMVVLVKAFDNYHHKFQFFQLSCKKVKVNLKLKLNRILIMGLLILAISTVLFEKLYTMLR